MDLVDELEFILSGFSVVLTALAMLWLVSAIMGLAFSAIGRRHERALSAAPAVALSTSAPAPAIEAGIPAAHVAAISAAVAVLTSGRGRVVSVAAPGHVSAAWAREGRTEQFSSHRVRWDWAIPGPPHVVQNVKAPGLTPPPASTNKRT